LNGSATLSLVIPTEAARISCHAALDKAAYAPFCKERRMKCISATKFHRKSGGAQWRDLQFCGPLLEMFFDRSVEICGFLSKFT